VPAREKAESVKGRLWTIEPKDVEAVSIKRASDTIRLKRVEGGWEMLEPVAARGDRGPIDEVITSLATARVDREVAANPAKLAEFGLDPAGRGSPHRGQGAAGAAHAPGRREEPDGRLGLRQGGRKARRRDPVRGHGSRRRAPRR
jgi:hypothetical protein